MKATIKKLSQSKVEITITVPYDEYLKAEEQAVQEISKEIKVDGFRSGHIPEAVIREKVDEATIKSVALEKIVPPTYSKAVLENNIQVIAQPKIDVKSIVKKEGDELVYTATVSTMPEVTVGDYKKIKVEKKEVKVDKKQIDETIKMITDRFAEWKDIKGVAKSGNRAELDFEGFDKEGKSIPNTASKNHPLILGSNTMIPGFEGEIIGMEVGAEKEFDITFPKEYHAKDMQGKKVKFKVKLGRLEESAEQKLDEAMIEKITGQKQSVADFVKRVEDDLKSEMEARTQQEHDNKVVQEIIKITKAELPEELVVDEIEMLKDEQKERASRQGLSWEQYLQHINKTDADFAKDHQKQAEERLLARLGVNHIVKDAKITVEDSDVEAKIDELLLRYPEDQKKRVREYYKKDSEGYRSLKNNLSADKLIKMLSK